MRVACELLSANKPAAGSAGIVPRLTIEHHCPGVPEPERSDINMIIRYQ
jgi:hypothetical protein